MGGREEGGRKKSPPPARAIHIYTLEIKRERERAGGGYSRGPSVSIAGVCGRLTRVMAASLLALSPSRRSEKSQRARDRQSESWRRRRARRGESVAKAGAAAERRTLRCVIASGSSAHTAAASIRQRSSPPRSLSQLWLHTPRTLCIPTLFVAGAPAGGPTLEEGYIRALHTHGRAYVSSRPEALPRPRVFTCVRAGPGDSPLAAPSSSPV